MTTHKISNSLSARTINFITRCYKTFYEGTMSCDTCGNRRFTLLAPQGRYSIVRCAHCRTITAFPVPTKEELARFYAQFAYNQSARQFDREKKDLAAYAIAAQLGVAERILGRKLSGRFLDVGCGNGFYLYGAKKLGFECYGTDLDEASVAYARSNFGAEVKKGLLEEAHFADGYFDCIHMRQVLEHVRFPRQDIRILYQWLKPGGVLIVSVPNTKSIEPFIKLYFLDTFKKLNVDMPGMSFVRKVFLSLGRPWGFVDPPRHLHGFDRHTLGLLLENEGFKVRKIAFGATGNKVYYPIGAQERSTMRENDRQALERLRERSKVLYAAFFIFFVPLQSLLRGYAHCAGKGAHLVVYAQKPESTDGHR